MFRNVLLAALVAFTSFAVTTHAAENERYSPEQKKAWCDANPEKCEAMKDRAADMKAKCDADPKACEEKKAEMHDRMQQRRNEMKAKCDADPQACEEKKGQMRDRMKERMQDRRQ